MKIKQLLAPFNLRGIELELYEKIFLAGEINASSAAKQINVSRTAVYDLLRKLILCGLVRETQRGGVKLFSAVSVELLEQLIFEKETEIRESKKSLDCVKRFQVNKKSDNRTKIEVFEGKKEIEQMMKDLLLYRDTTMKVFWPVASLLKHILDPNFMKEFHEKRIARNISIQVLWDEKDKEQIKKYPFLSIDKKLLRDVKLAPTNLDFSFGYAIYANKVRFLSVKNDPFGFLVENRDLAKMLEGQFDFIWGKSRILK
jgi:sugar-specific transcriptional regulator TrmB